MYQFLAFCRTIQNAKQDIYVLVTKNVFAVLNPQRRIRIGSLIYDKAADYEAKKMKKFVLQEAKNLMNLMSLSL